VNARRFPGWILSNHTEDQGANLFADTLPSSYLADSGDPRPIQRNPARCQFTTVLGVTKTRGCFHPDQHILNATQNSLCRAVNRRGGRSACRASNCRRRARFSRTRVRPATERTDQPAEEMSERHDHGKNLAETSESSFAPSHSFHRCTTFWRGTGFT